MPRYEKAFQYQLIAIFYSVANKSENYRRKLAAKTQNGSPRITEFQSIQLKFHLKIPFENSIKMSLTHQIFR